MMNNNNTASVLFDNHELIEEAVEKLHENGFDMELYITIPDYYLLEETEVEYNYLGDRIKRCCAIGAVVAGTWGVLFGAALLFIL